MDAAYKEVYKAHSRHIDFLGIRNTPALVVFSGVPGSGKSELTKRLINNYGFLRIANKDIRKALEQTGHTNDVAIGDYTLWLFNKLTEEYPLSIVFDRNIDQWYEPARDWAMQNSYQLIVVRIEVPRQRLEKRLLRREGSSTASVFNVLDFYSEEHEKMNQKIKPDMVLEDDYDLDVAVQQIAERLHFHK